MTAAALIASRAGEAGLRHPAGAVRRAVRGRPRGLASTSTSTCSGLRQCAPGPATLYLKGWEERQHHSLVLRAGEHAAAGRLRFRVRPNDDLPLLAAEFEQRGCTVRWVDAELAGWAGAARLGSVRLPARVLPRDGAARDAAAALRPAPRRAGHAPRPLQPSRPALEDALGFWRELGFRCSEYISTDGADERLTGAWLLRKPTVHDVALTAGTGPRLHHLGSRSPSRSACCAPAISSPRPATPA